MKRWVLTAAILAAFVAVSPRAEAAVPNGVALQAATQALSHGGHHGHRHGHPSWGYHSGRYGHGYRYVRPGVIVNPPLYYVPGYRVPTYYYPGYYGPYSGLQYYGPRFGLSIGF